MTAKDGKQTNLAVIGELLCGGGSSNDRIPCLGAAPQQPMVAIDTHRCWFAGSIADQVSDLAGKGHNIQLVVSGGPSRQPQAQRLP